MARPTDSRINPAGRQPRAPRRQVAPRARPRPQARVRPGARGLRGPMQRRGVRDTGALAAGARSHLRGFRQATILAVAITAFILLLLAPDDEGGAQQPAPADTPAAQVQAVPDTVAIIEPVAVEDLQKDEAAVEEEPEVRPDAVARVAMDEAVATLRTLWISFLANLPRVLVAVAVLFLAWGMTRLIRPVLRRGLRHWERSNAAVALFGVGTWLIAIGIAVSVLVGDIRALVGSLGLVGLALSWALQTPIESFTGWLLNSFQGYYRVGDRVAVGEVFGDVYRIDVLTTTVWEIGSPDRDGFVAAEQPTGRLITFPNFEVLRGSIVNLTRDFPYVWDEVSIAVANKSDLDYARDVLQHAVDEVIGDTMAEPARQYAEVLRHSRLEFAIAERPEVFVSLDDSWTTMTVRYLVPARQRRLWKSRVSKAAMEAYTADEHAHKILAVFPRRQIQFIGPDGKPREVPGVEGGARSEE
jgi:small-conductance mechanosensitive channel